MMELRGTGFNALGQIQSCLVEENLDDIGHFKELGRGKSIEVLYTGWAHTVFLIDGNLSILGLQGYDGTKLLGYINQDQLSTSLLLPDLPWKLISAAGSESEGLLALTIKLSSTPKLYVASSIINNPCVSLALKSVRKSGSNEAPFVEWPPTYTSNNGRVHVFAVAIASSGVTAAVLSHRESENKSTLAQSDQRFKAKERWTKVVQFNTTMEFFEHLCLLSQGTEDEVSRIQGERAEERGFRTFTIPGQVKSLLANALSFVLLTEQGMVWTWACESRFAQALGRDSTGAANTATSPGVVEDLVGLNIVHIAVGGWIAGAVSESGEAWVWGCDAPGARDAGGGTISHQFFSHLKKINGVEQDCGNQLIKLSIPSMTEYHAMEQPPSVRSTEDLDSETEVEIIDLAIGEAHLLVLDSNGVGWCCGSNAHGQLGIRMPQIRNMSSSEQGRVDMVSKGAHKPVPLHNAPWTTLDLYQEQHPVGRKVRRVFCGEATSFVMIEGTDN